MKVKVVGNRPVKVTVIQRARGTKNFRAFKRVKTYRSAVAFCAGWPGSRSRLRPTSGRLRPVGFTPRVPFSAVELSRATTVTATEIGDRLRLLTSGCERVVSRVDRSV